MCYRQTAPFDLSGKGGTGRVSQCADLFVKSRDLSLGEVAIAYSEILFGGAHYLRPMVILSVQTGPPEE